MARVCHSFPVAPRVRTTIPASHSGGSTLRYRCDAPPLRARAYCGAAHHQAWSLMDGNPPGLVELPVAAGVERYRLVRHPRTGRPARDHHGNVVYVPAPESTIRRWYGL